MENNKIGSREWVKTATIIFLAILLVLTFFSNTIMNRTLPEVASSVAESGSITARVRGTGKLTAVDNTQVKASATRYVGQINVKEGQEVKAGDLLFTMGNGDSDELETAQDNLDSLQFTLQRNQLSYPSGSAEQVYLSAQDDYAEAYANWDAANKKLEDLTSGNEKLDAARDEYNAAAKKLKDDQDLLQKAQEDLDKAKETAQHNLEVAEQDYQYKLDLYDGYGPNYEDQEVATAYASQLQAANEVVVECQKALYKYESGDADESKEVARLESIVESDETDVEYKEAVYISYTAESSAYTAAATALEAAESRLTAAKTALNSAYSSYLSQQASDNKTAASAAIDAAETQSKIEKAQAKVDSLSGADPVEITAPCDGTVTSISAVAGSKVAKDDVMCIIESPDKGYTVSYSVTTDQARRIKVGDTGTISNYFWSSEITATVSSIKVDQTDPQNKKTITFDVVGDDLTTGSELTISVGSRSSSYDLIIPSSAVRTDSNGSFVLVITAKNSALGNRYYAKRVSVEVLASDDVNSAISGDLESGDFVVTTSSAPISSGDQVRMADS